MYVWVRGYVHGYAGCTNSLWTAGIKAGRLSNRYRVCWTLFMVAE